ncbi:sulfite exporter TauE/SafE family protein [Tunicatimonas pelagia]|uniref:sulfite exporter TauE/SafE family protein n=1 Tax=Tunicatimonas pelagia TaxID=931531 RepID=UPI0026656FB6|nr:sulfite exporter TauE/SafE family protein [Tunicatimonas pelagia]WKN42122.1 sulfite exporter TauE/SafE family protein [Tunicatimonas pelagia]
MSTIELIGYISAAVIGFSLGLIGGGGSILTVPALVYLIGTDPVLSTSYSLFIVGVAALVGSLNYMKQGLVSYRTAVIFAIPSLTAVYVTRRWIVPVIPEEIAHWGDFVLTKSIAVMVFFAILMAIASFSMIYSDRKPEADNKQEALRFNYPLILLEGTVVGVLTGLVGAGGGFLIIPALVLLVKLPMKLAIGTSLLIIAAKSLIGFGGDIGVQPIEWMFLLSFTAIAVIGIFAGTYVARFVASQNLKIGFGWFVLAMSVFIIVNELIIT